MPLRSALEASADASVSEPEQLGHLWPAVDAYLSLHPQELEEMGELKSFTDPAPLSEIEHDTLWRLLRHRIREDLEGRSDLDDGSWRRFLVKDLEQIEVFGGDSRFPSVDRIREFVLALSRGIIELNVRNQLRISQALVLRQATLQNAFPALVFCLRDRADLAVRYLIDERRSIAASLGVPLDRSEITTEIQSPLALETYDRDPDWPSERQLLWTFQTVVFQILREEQTLREAQEHLIEIKTTLDLDAGEVGKWLGVKEATVRVWEAAEKPIPRRIASQLAETQEALRRLKSMFLPERLPQVVRRPAELFDGDSALDWILQGRLREVADRYELLLRYQA